MGMFDDFVSTIGGGAKKFGKGLLQSAKDDPLKFALTGGLSGQLDGIGAMIEGDPAPEETAPEDIQKDTETLLAKRRAKERARLQGQRSTLLTERNLLLNPRLRTRPSNETSTSTLLG